MRRIALLLTVVITGCAVHAAPPPRTAERRDDRNDRRFDRHSAWDKLGERWVDGRVDRDVVPVARRERYQRIMVVVEHSAVELFDVVIVFGNGQVYSPGTRLIFGQGQTSREIDLPGDGLAGVGAFDRVLVIVEQAASGRLVEWDRRSVE